MTNTNGPDHPTLLSEQYVQDCFHSYLKSSLTQAKAEKLLDTEILSSAEADLMITGPALCLYFAALRSTTDPPSVPLPRLTKTNSAPTDLSLTNCPPQFRPFLIVWSQTVPAIQSLAPEYQHDLARIICNLSPVSQPLLTRLNGIAADLRAVAIEISMRRTFQDRYAGDLQAAIDAGGAPNLRVKASFVPPPSYDIPSSPSPSTAPSPTPPKLPPKEFFVTNPSRVSLSPVPPSSHPMTPTILTSSSPPIEFIRETLYAALADVLERMPALRRVLATNPTRAYFASVAFAILDVANSTTSRVGEDPVIRGVLDQSLSLSQCPPELKPLMKEFCDIGLMVRQIEEADSLTTVAALQRGKEPPVPRLEHVRSILEGGVGKRTTSIEGRAVAFANRINALALGMTKLKAFKERQDMVFKVLAGVGG